MRHIGRLAAIAAVMAVAGCSHLQLVEARIYPDRYEVGEVQSALATPAVDEVVRRNPRQVIVRICRNTPVQKHIQFIRELQARSSARVGGNFLDEGCPA